MVPPDDDVESTLDTAVPPLIVRDEATARVSAAFRLVCVAGTDLGRTFRIEHPTVTIGRGHVDVPLRTRDVSRHHARIFRRTHDHAIEDLGSSNHTYVNGVEIRGSTPLRAGDRIQVGSTVFVFAHHDALEDRMHQLQRLEALGTLAGGLAHDFNNALAVILGGLELVEQRIDPGDELREMIQEMRGAATSASHLARRLLRLGRSSEPLEFETIDLDALVQRTLGMIRRQLPREMTVETEVPAGLRVRGSHEELHQVLLNLVLNARDAMPRGGVLRISARPVTFDRLEAAEHQLHDKGNYVELVVRDTGIGMAEETLARAFEPFFTTKAPGEGTGLGLAIIHGIVRRHGGDITVSSRVGEGTTFQIWLTAAA